MYRLIIADDEENIRNGMANSLPWREWGYEVAAVCASGQEVLDRMEDCRPDVVLSDIRMPGMGGEDMVVLYSSGEEIAPGDVRADIEAIQRAVRDGLRVTLSAGVSDLCTEPGMLPQAYEQANCSAKQSAFVGHESVYFFSQMQRERPAGMPYFDTEQVEKALLAQDYDALRAEIDRVLQLLAERLPEYRTVDQLCLSLLFHVSLWGLRYGIQMEEVLRSLGAHYTDIYQSETLAAKRDFVLACLFGCQQALAARRRSHSHAVKSVAMWCG